MVPMLYNAQIYRLIAQTHRLARGSALLVALAGAIAGWSLTSATPAQASSGPNEVQTEPAEATANGVLLKGELNPGGLPTTYYFEYIEYGGGRGSCECVPGRTAVAGPLTGSTLQEAPSIEVTGLLPGQKYGYWLIASNVDGTRAGGFIEFTAPPRAERPSEVQTEPAETTASGVLLKGKLNPGGLPTTYYFEYGPVACDESPRCVKTTAVAGPLTGSNRQEAPPIEVTGLVPGEKYWYQIVASNADGTREGGFLYVTAPATGEPPSEVQTEPAEATANGLLLKGELNPGGLPTTHYFEYGPVACDESPRCVKTTAVAGPLTGSNRQEAPPIEVTGLVPGEKYWYQIVASNADGTREGGFLYVTAPATGEPPSEVQTELESKLDPPTLLVTPPTTTSPPSETMTAPGPLTKAQKLANTLKVCESKPKRQRARCDKRAHVRYGTAPAKATKKTGKQASRGKK
jgi:hypothetical protein